MRRFVFRAILPLVMVLLSVGVYLWLSYPRESGEGEERRAFVLDTVVRVKTFEDEDGRAAREAFREMERMERMGDVHHKNSLIGRLNLKKELSWSPGFASERPKETARDLADLQRILSLSRRLAGETRGAFDPTVGPLVELWDIGKKNRIPSRQELKETLPRVGHRNLVISRDGVRLERGAKVDLGGILKGYAVDRAVAVLQDRGIDSALISAVSSIRALGEKPGGRLWKVGVENPRPKEGAPFLAVLELKDGQSVSTSGDYQQYFIRGGRRYHHILDPRTGEPARGFLSLTVVTDRSAAEADALSTSLFVMGYPKAFHWADERDLAVLAVTSDGSVRWTEPMAGIAEDVLRNIGKD